MAFIKKKKPKVKNFIMRIDTKVDEMVDQALAMVEQGKIEMAEKIIFELLENNSDIHTVQYAMGVIRGMKGLLDEAIGYFDRAIDIFPYFTEAWFNKGIAHQQKFEIREMIRSYQKVVEIGDPEEDIVCRAKELLQSFEQQVRNNVGISLTSYLTGMDIFNQAFAAMEQKKWSIALWGFKKVLTLDPRHKQSYGNMGICYGQLGYKEEALKALDKALELDPEYEPARINRDLVNLLKKGEKLKEKIVAIEYNKESFRRRE